MPPEKVRKDRNAKNPWLWIPSLYFAEGLPYMVVMIVSVVMYKRLGVSNTDIALYTSWLYLPWVIKPLWSPIVDLLKTKRYWILLMQFTIGLCFALIGLHIPAPDFFKWTLLFFWLLAFNSATHDIAIDGFYMIALPEKDQAFFIGIRSTFYRLAMIAGQGFLVILAGYFEIESGLPDAKFRINAKNDIQINTDFNPQKRQLKTKNTLELICEPIHENISTQNISEARLAKLIEAIGKENTQNGHFPKEKTTTTNKTNKKKRNTFSDKLSRWLKKHFNKQKKTNKKTTGNVAIVSLHLSSKPKNNEKIHADIRFHSGDKSIKILKYKGQNFYDKFEFNEKNWNKPAFTLIQLDPRLTKNASAVFRVYTGDIPFAWSLSFYILSIMFGIFFIYHMFIIPKPEKIGKTKAKAMFREFFATFLAFFKKKNIFVAILFFLTYRLAEAQLAKIAIPFLIDTQNAGGLGLTTGEIGWYYGTIGIICLMLGGIFGGILVSRKGLKFCLWWMFLAMNLPNATYVYLSFFMPVSRLLIGAAIAVEQFGYGFGFTAYMLYMIYISKGEYKTSHFAITTGFMALGMMIPGMWSGWLQEAVSYQSFFIWVLICMIPIALPVGLLKIDSEFGKKTE
ncbi:MAG: MFS transporter [Bacteroidia bacterium]|nr:MAG: MFS transporter [Bacteroidia bacterium]